MYGYEFQEPIISLLLRHEAETTLGGARDDASSDSPAKWHRESQQRWDSLTRMLQSTPEDKILLLARGRLSARMGRFSDAACDYLRLMDLWPSQYECWTDGLPVLAQAGKLDDYRRRRSQALHLLVSDPSAQGGNADRLGKACMMLPLEPDELASVASLVARAHSNNNWNKILEGLLEYRSGHWDAAAARSMQNTDTGEFKIPSELIAGMAFRHLGKTADARAAMDRAP